MRVRLCPLRYTVRFREEKPRTRVALMTPSLVALSDPIQSHSLVIAKRSAGVPDIRQYFLRRIACLTAISRVTPSATRCFILVRGYRHRFQWHIRIRRLS
jgi:hypothetical protein